MNRLRLSQAAGVPYWRQIRDAIADQIRAGILEAGGPLPSVRQLAADLLVSVITVKKAYDELEGDGLVVSHQGRGTFVAERGAAASRARLLRDVEEEIDRAVARAATVGVSRSEAEAATRASLTRHYRRSS
jgi:GntR family transcriptional regulator